MFDFLKGQLRFWRMEPIKTSRSRREAERMKPAGIKTGEKPDLPRKFQECDGSSTGSSFFSYFFKVGKEEKGGKMFSEEGKAWH